jgi:anti-anti-sigma factor
MGIQTWSEDLIVVDLPRELEAHSSELQSVVDTLRCKSICDVVVNFSNTDIVGSLTFSRLLELRRVLRDSGRKLVLCSVAPAAKAVFTIALVDKLFDFAEDVPAALATLQACT